MSASALSLLGFVLWTILLLTLIAAHRVLPVLAGKKQANEFPADRDHGGSPFYRRLLRVHLNCVENLPLYSAIILVAMSLSMEGLTDPLAYPFLGLRVAQGTVHLAGTTNMLVNVRFACYVGQLAIMLLMISRLAF